MVGSEISKEESVMGFISNISNLEHEYIHYFSKIPKELSFEKNKLMGIKQNNRYADLIVTNTNKKLGKLALDFINSVIENIETDIDIKKKKGINFSSLIKDLIKTKRDINSKKYNIGELMILYQERFIEDMIIEYDNKTRVYIYQSKWFWFSVIFSFILGILTEYFGDVIRWILLFF